MKPRAILDENVSLQVAERLRRLGYEVFVVAQQPQRGRKDETVFAFVAEGPSVLVTRDAHFTNPVRFPPDKTAGILYLAHGNLRGSDEADLVERFLMTHKPEGFQGRLVYLAPGLVRIR